MRQYIYFIMTYLNIKHKISPKLFIFSQLYLNTFMHNKIDVKKTQSCFLKNYAICKIQLRNSL